MPRSFDIAKEIVDHRRVGLKAASESEPWAIRDQDNAEAIQELATTLMSERVLGWKLGALDKPARERLKLSRPFLGRVFESGFYSAGETLRPPIAPVCYLEVELAARFDRTLPPNRNHTKADVEAAIGSWHLALELITFTRPFSRQTTSGLEILADNGGCAGIVVGSHIPDDVVASIHEQEMELSWKSGVVSRSAVHVEKTELVDRIVWLANHLDARGFGLSEGQFVLTGNLTGMFEFKAGEAICAAIPDVGSVSIAMPSA